MPTEQSTVMYICAQHASFSFRAATKRFKFKNHVLRVETKEDMQTIDAMLEQNQSIGMKVCKADKQAAEALSRAYIASRGGAAKGMFNSQHSPSVVKPLRERDAAFASLPPETVDALTDKIKEDSALLLTEKTKQSAKS